MYAMLLLANILVGSSNMDHSDLMICSFHDERVELSSKVGAG